MSQATQQRIAEELQEFAFTGPFGGVQSELPIDLIERFGFSDAQNILFTRAQATIRPGYEFAAPLPNGDVAVGLASFYDKLGIRHTVAFAPTRVYELQINTWSQVAGVLTGTPTDLMSWAVVNYTLLFSQGIDKVQAWDGISAGFAAVSSNAVPARYLLELDTHLVAAFTTESGTLHTQRIRWTGAGDPTDWTSPNAGVGDVLNGFGPITGLGKAFGNGVLLHPQGVTLIVPTGIGTNPFSTPPFNYFTRGGVFPNTVASLGDNGIVYLTRSDIVLFNGTSYQSLGAIPINDGRSYSGARTRIFADIATAGDPSQIYGISSLALVGFPFNAYWLIVPGVALWLYNVDEANWTRFIFDKTPKVMGIIHSNTTAQQLRIIDLIGRIEDQFWSPASLLAGLSTGSFFDTVGVGFTDGTVGWPNFSLPCESAWLLSSGMLTMGDKRHNKTIERFRLVYVDDSDINATLVLTNNRGEVVQQEVAITRVGTGRITELMLYPKISGLVLRWQLFGDPGMRGAFTEFAPIYNTGGEYKNN